MAGTNDSPEQMAERLGLTIQYPLIDFDIHDPTLQLIGGDPVDLSLERVGSGQAVNDAEDLVESQQRAEIIGKAIVDAWNHIVETPDELLVDLIAETAERIRGFKPEPELVKQFWCCSTSYPVSGMVESNRRNPTRNGPSVVTKWQAKISKFRAAHLVLKISG